MHNNLSDNSLASYKIIWFKSDSAHLYPAEILH